MKPRFSIAHLVLSSFGRISLFRFFPLFLCRRFDNINANTKPSQESSGGTISIRSSSLLFCWSLHLFGKCLLFYCIDFDVIKDIFSTISIGKQTKIINLFILFFFFFEILLCMHYFNISFWQLGCHQL